MSSHLNVTVDPGKVVRAVASVANGIGGRVVALGSVLASEREKRDEILFVVLVTFGKIVVTYGNILVTCGQIWQQLTKNVVVKCV